MPGVFWGWVSHLLALVMIAGLSAVVALRQPFSPLRRPLLLANAAALIFVLGDLGTLFAPDLPTKHLALALLYGGGLWIPPLWWWLAVRFREMHAPPTRWSPWMVRGPVVFSAAVWLVALTNVLHGRFVTPVLDGRNVHHEGFVVAIAGSYAIALAVCAVHARLALRRDLAVRVRLQALLLAAATLAPLTCNLLYNATPWNGAADPTVTGLAVTSALLVLGIYGARLFGLSPVALREVIRHDASGVLLVDRLGRLCFANEALKTLLGTDLEPGARAVGALAARLRATESDERVPEGELWSQAYKPDRHGSGILYRLAGDEARFAWVSVKPIPSRWRSEAAWCFRVEDVTRLQVAERDRARLEERLGRISEDEILASALRALEDPIARIRAIANYGLVVSARNTPDDALLDDCFRAIQRETARCEGRLRRAGPTPVSEDREAG